MFQTRSEQIEVDRFVTAPYLRVLTYPVMSLRIGQSRLSQLRQAGVSGIIFEGKTKIGRLGVLGVGTVSVVVKAEMRGKVCALKIRRTDANREDMKTEFELTSFANRIGVGPLVISFTRDFIIMQYLQSLGIDSWLRSTHGKGRRSRIRGVVHSLLNQCRRLDIVGLDHGQLSNLRKHVVIVEDDPYIIDFESASRLRAPKNVTTAAQYFFVGGKISSLMRRLTGVKDTLDLMAALRRYKREMSDISYSRLLDASGVTRN